MPQGKPQLPPDRQSGRINPALLTGVQSIGICGATSTPKWLMEEISKAIYDIVN